MNKYKFFIDTANVDYIRKTWDFLSKSFSANDLIGITTNPNAFNKESCLSLKSWEERTKSLVALITEIYDNQPGGYVHVQLPNSNISQEEARKFVKIISEWGDGKTQVSLKIPPFTRILELVQEFQKAVNVNVTGLSDLGNALRSVTYGVDYISIIPGRMEEKGIHAQEQIHFINSCKLRHTKIITGSMRTLKGLKEACQIGTIPTIGTRVFDAMFKDSSPSEFRSYWDSEGSESKDFSPFIDDKMVNLSVSFFEEMDKLGIQTYQDLKQYV